MSEQKGQKNENRNPDGTLKEGHNVKSPGRPKGSGVSIVNELKEILAKPSDPTDAGSMQKKTELAHKIIDKAIQEGDHKVMKMIVEQLDGKPTQKKDITSDGEKIEFTIPQEIADKNEINSRTEEDS